MIDPRLAFQMGLPDAYRGSEGRMKIRTACYDSSKRPANPRWSLIGSCLSESP